MYKSLFSFILSLAVLPTVLAQPITVETGSLADRKFHPSGLYAIWTGLENTVPSKAIVDFRKQLTLAWALKCRRNACTDVARKASESIPNRYPAKPTTMSMAEYLRFIDQEVGRAHRDMDWEGIAKEYRLTQAELGVLQKMARAIGSRELVAYSLTELMPSVKDGDLNEAVLRFLLRYAGREYIELLPAVNDKYTSFGPYQFTQYALFDNGHEVRGASRSNQSLKRGQIGGSVMKLKGPGHHRAAWLFALDNLAKLTRQSTPRELAALHGLAQRPGELVKVIACAHHAPAPCKRAAARWIEHGAKGGFGIQGRVNAYEVKTGHNYRALGR